MAKQFKIYIIVLLAMVFAFSFIWFKEANHLRPMTIVFSRLVLATVLIVVYLFITKQFQNKKGDFKLFSG